MAPNILEYIIRLTYKKCGLKYQTFAEDIIQEVCIKVIQDNITNLLEINKWVVYYFNKEKRQAFKKITLTPKYDFIEEAVYFDSSKVKELFIEFVYQSKIKKEHIDLFTKVKFDKIKYKDLGVKNENVASVYVWRVYKAFKEYIQKRKIKLIDFYEDR